jgi:transposase
VRPSSHKDLQPLGPDAFPRSTLPNGKEVGLLEFPREFHGQTRRLIVTYNPRRAQWQGGNLTRKLQETQAEIHAWFKERLNVKKWRAADKVAMKIQEFIQDTGYTEFLTSEVTGSFGQVSYTLQLNETALQAHLRTLGKSFFMTNHPTLTPLEIVWLYRQQYTIERAFKYLKSPTILRVTPIFHWKDECIRGHLFTCVLGLLLLMLLCRQVETVFPHLSLFTILDLLAEIEVAEIKVEGSRKILRKLVGMSPEAKQLADLFAIDTLL